VKEALALSASALALAAAGCGGNDEPEGTVEEEAAATPREAIAEIAEVREGLDEGLVAYRKGDSGEADQLVGDAYLEHFELVEAPLEERDPELNEELEVLISTTIRDAIKAGDPVNEVSGLVREANDGLNEAERALERG
jgi:hypothetical protein